MGGVVSVLGECLGRVHPPRGATARVAAPAPAPAHKRPPCPPCAPACKGGGAAAAASAGAASARAPPPLVPDAGAVYDLVQDDDACPTCLEGYADDNPRVVPECGHDAHLQCILVWNERSGSRLCPVCAEELRFDGADALLA